MSLDDEIFSLSEFFPDIFPPVKVFPYLSENVYYHYKETRKICWSIIFEPFSSYKEKKNVELDVLFLL